MQEPLFWKQSGILLHLEMNEKALKTLEYDKIIERLTEYASTPLGKEACRKLVPMDDLHEIETAQRETTDALTRILQHGTLSFSGTKSLFEI